MPYCFEYEIKNADGLGDYVQTEDLSMAFGLNLALGGTTLEWTGWNDSIEGENLDIFRVHCPKNPNTKIYWGAQPGRVSDGMFFEVNFETCAIRRLKNREVIMRCRQEPPM